jgi:hypothetical protein
VIKDFIREHLKSPPIFDGSLDHYRSESSVDSEYAQRGTTVQELFNALELYDRASCLAVISAFDAVVVEVNTRACAMVDISVAENLAKERGINIYNDDPSFTVGPCILVTDDGRVYKHPDELTHRDFENNTEIHIASSSVRGPSLGHGTSENISLFDVVERLRNFDKLNTLAAAARDSRNEPAKNRSRPK